MTICNSPLPCPLLLRQADGLEDAVEIAGVIVLDDNAATAFAGGDVDLGGEVSAEAFLKGEDIG